MVEKLVVVVVEVVATTMLGTAHSATDLDVAFA